MSKKLLSMLLVVAMLLTMLPAGYAQGADSGDITVVDAEPELIRVVDEPEAKAEEPALTAYRVNPLYRGLISEDAVLAELSAIQPKAAAEADCATLAEAAAALREGMKAREETVTFTYTGSGSFSWDEPVELAMEHTGEPTEGDYLLWQYAGVGYSRSGSRYTYYLSYYTDAAQEAELDAAVDALLASLDLDGRTDYEKVRAIYDYITANITYDYDNLEDPDYMLMYTAYAALINKTAVCQGYSNLLYRLLLTVGVDTRIVTSPEHAWNIVGLDGLYYAADSTWDAGLSRYRYFLISVANMDTVEYHDREAPYNTPEFEAAYPFSPLDYGAGLAITAVTFPDDVFRAYVSNNFDKDSNGFLSDAEIAAVTEIEFDALQVASLQGIAYFPKLTRLETTNMWGDETPLLTEVDLSGNTKLKTLGLGFTEITSLDVTMLPELESLMLGYTKLSGVDLSGNPELRELWIDDSLFTGLDLSANPELALLDACGNPDLSVIDIRPCASLVADYKAGGRHLEWMKEISQELYDSVIVYGGSGDGGMDDHDYNLAVNTWMTVIAGDTPEIIASGQCGDDVYWTLDSDDLLTISGTGDMWDYDWDNRAGWYAYHESIQNSVISDGVTSVGGYAFNMCTALTSVTIPDSVTSLGDYAFSDCSSLPGVTIPENVTSLGMGVFRACGSLTSVTIPARVTSIDDYAFSFCGLTEIRFEGSAPAIGGSCFSWVTATAYYPANDPSWTEDVMQDYGGTITWVAYGEDTPVGLPIDAEHFPDDVFRAYVAETLDPDGNGYLTDEELAPVTVIDVTDRGITTLCGINYFPALTELYCSLNILTELDVSKNPELTKLSCDLNKLTELDVSNNPKLKELDCGFNLISSLDVSDHAELLALSCGSEALNELDVSGCTALEALNCNKSSLTALDVSSNTKLMGLACTDNGLSALDISGNPDLGTLFCYGNSIATLDLSQCSKLAEAVTQGDYIHGSEYDSYVKEEWMLRVDAATELITAAPPEGLPIDEENFPDANFRAYVADHFDPDRNGYLTDAEIADIKVVDVSGQGVQTLRGIEYFPAMTTLHCSLNELTELDVSRNSALTNLECGQNELSSLDISNNLALKELVCWRNQLTELDISANLELYFIDAAENKLSVLDVSKNTALTMLRCNDNELTELDVSNNTALQELRCQNNDLSSLDISNNPLWMLYCSNNKLTELDLSGNPEMKHLSCYGNSIATLDISQCPLLVEAVQDGTMTVDEDRNAIIYAGIGDLYWGLIIDSTTELITGISAGYSITVDLQYVTNSKGKVLAGTDLDPDALYSGEVDIVVTSESDQAVLVAVKNGDEYTPLACSTDENGVHSFTVMVEEDTVIVLAMKGDVNLDGEVKLKDNLMVKKHIAKSELITNPLALLTANVDGSDDGKIRLKDNLMIKKHIAKSQMIEW